MDRARDGASNYVGRFRRRRRSQRVGPKKWRHLATFCVQAQAAEDVLEWLQPSGRRPEGCCCSTELSGGRGRLPEATGYRHRRTMHVPCMPTLTLADVCGRQPDSHQSFDPTSRNAAGRCSTSASMCGSRAAQREQRSSDGEGRDCSPPRTAAVRSDKHSGLWSDASSHCRPIPVVCCLFLTPPALGSMVRSFGTLYECV